MNENLNLVELLKDCPVGTKFYSSYLGRDVFFIGVHDNYIECEYHSTVDLPFNSMIQFRKEGSFFKDGECMIFPSKDQRDWSKWHRPFVDGDIIAYMFYNKPTIYIYREGGSCNTSYYAAYSSENNKFYGDGKGALAFNRHDLRFATEEEKQKLFDVIREKGYKWNPETKTLEKLIEPKFKVGDTIRSKNGLQTYKVTNITSEYYSMEAEGHACVGVFPVKDQDEWVLIPNKFDLKTLKPFESRVLVSTFGKWVPAIFGHYNKEHALPIVVVGGNVYAKCIPYEGNEHLLDTYDEPSEFYRYWED